MPEFIFPDWPDAHTDAASDPRETLLVPFGRSAVHLHDHQRVVLDSGAFARSFVPKDERVPASEWMRELADWYRVVCAHYGKRVRWCVAPDVFGDPAETYRLWVAWQERYADVSVVPVIQLWPNKPRDLMTVLRESKRYPGQPIVMLSNPAKMHAAAWGPLLDDLCKIIREQCGAQHIHLLGAGWSLTDIKQYQTSRSLASMDSITYYQAAQRGERWCACAACAACRNSWQEAALHHAASIKHAVQHG